MGNANESQRTQETNQDAQSTGNTEGLKANKGRSEVNILNEKAKIEHQDSTSPVRQELRAKKTQGGSASDPSLSQYDWANTATIQGDARHPTESLNARGLRLKELVLANAHLPEFFKQVIP